MGNEKQPDRILGKLYGLNQKGLGIIRFKTFKMEQCFWGNFLGLYM